MEKPKISLIVATDSVGGIGKNNKIPWYLPEDIKRFKHLTMGHPVIMGRKTFESIGRILPGRKNIVISRNSNWQHDGVEVFNGLEKAILNNNEFTELCIIGGGEIFSQAIPLIDKLHITIIDVKVSNPSTFFPEIDFSEWRLVKREAIVTHDQIHCEFNEYDRVRNRSS